MAKQVRVWTGTQWDTLAVTLPDLSNYSTTTQMNTAIDNAKGAVFIAGTSFTAATNVDFTSCFSSTYQDYLVTSNITACSTSAAQVFYLLNGTTPATTTYTSTYKGWGNNNGTSDSFVTNSNLGYMGMDLVGTGAIGQSSAILNNPFATSFTRWIGNSMFGGAIVRFGGGYHETAASYNGIRFSATAGTMTGTIRIYGLRNS